MADPGKIKEFNKRIGIIEDILVEAAGGNFDAEIPMIPEETDMLTSIEMAINLLIADLGDEVRQSQQKAKDLEEKLELIEQQRKAIEELSTPIIKMWDKVLVLPLIGTLDTRRSQKLTEALLTDIAATQTKVTIIDITGVPTIDSAVANHLLKTVAAVQLLGAECLITGIRPDVAQTMVHLGVDLAGVETLSNLGEGLKLALSKLHLRITEEQTD
jgi:rsbT co-antagonist protein RsbR